MKAESLKRLDKERDIHLQAFLNNAVTETIERGKKSYPKYPQFKKFFDYDKRKREMLGEKEVKQESKSKIRQLILIANQKGG